MNINDKKIPTQVVREIKLLLYAGRVTIDDIINIINKKMTKVKIDYDDVTAIEEL